MNAETDNTQPQRPPLKYLLNPCDIDRLPALARVGDALAAIWRGFTYGTECQCCLGARVLGLVLAASSLGFALAHVLPYVLP